MSSRKKRTAFSHIEKVDILEALKRGESGASLSQKYGVNASVISQMKRQKDAILSYVKKTEEAGCSDRKIMRTSRFEEMDEALYVWFLQNCTAGNPVALVSDRNGEKAEKLHGREKSLDRLWLSKEGVNEPPPFRRLHEKSICSRSEKIGKTGKVHLLIDNAPAHPVIDLMNSVDELVTVKFFPPNVISWIQPMDQEKAYEVFKPHFSFRKVSLGLVTAESSYLSLFTIYSKRNRIVLSLKVKSEIVEALKGENQAIL
uniref:HTH psq-type domain-containing protein n=1 Tax=Trichuris muris TaxID=70415 RepID=A0A5S6QDX8_TRIMR